MFQEYSITFNLIPLAVDSGTSIDVSQHGNIDCCMCSYYLFVLTEHYQEILLFQ